MQTRKKKLSEISHFWVISRKTIFRNLKSSKKKVLLTYFHVRLLCLPCQCYNIWSHVAYALDTGTPFHRVFSRTFFSTAWCLFWMIFCCLFFWLLTLIARCAVFWVKVPVFWKSSKSSMSIELDTGLDAIFWQRTCRTSIRKMLRNFMLVFFFNLNICGAEMRIFNVLIKFGGLEYRAYLFNCWQQN